MRNLKCFVLILTFYITNFCFSSEVKILSPRGGFTTSEVIEITGSVSDTSAERVTLVMNGIPQTIKVNSGSFRTKSVSLGSNTIEVKHGKRQ